MERKEVTIKIIFRNRDPSVMDYKSGMQQQCIVWFDAQRLPAIAACLEIQSTLIDPITFTFSSLLDGSNSKR